MEGSLAMVRSLAAIVMAVLCVVGSTWLVGREGRMYRESLRRTRSVADAPSAPPSVGDMKVVVDEEGDQVPTPVRPRRESPSPSEISIPDAPPMPTGTEGNSPPSPMTASVPPSPRVSPKPPPQSIVRPDAGELTTILSRWKDDPIWSQADQAGPWDLDRLTNQGERRLGEQLNRLILRLNPDDRGLGLRRVRDAAKPFLEQLERKDPEYQFFVLNSEVANAFSHPGRYVYVSRELLDMIPEDEEYLLEFVVGHEIAHVELQHALACLKAPDVRRFRDGILQKLYFLIIPHGYPDKLEYEADAWVYRRMKRLRRSEYECLKFLRILDNYSRRHGFHNGRGKPQELLTKELGDPDDVAAFSLIDNHLRSHPAAYERLNRLKGLGGQVSHPPR